MGNIVGALIATAALYIITRIDFVKMSRKKYKHQSVQELNPMITFKIV